MALKGVFWDFVGSGYKQGFLLLGLIAIK